MANTVDCAYCNKEYKPSDSHKIKFCEVCEMWCCKDCAKSSFTKCPKCEKYKLK